MLKKKIIDLFLCEKECLAWKKKKTYPHTYDLKSVPICKSSIFIFKLQFQMTKNVRKVLTSTIVQSKSILHFVLF